MNILMIRFVRYLSLTLMLLAFSVASHADAPKLNFSDLISGPDTGLNDGQGSGVVVTFWGQQLGDVQGSSSITFIDSSGKSFTPYVYYWKKADGKLPGGPANLYASHINRTRNAIAQSGPAQAVPAGHVVGGRSGRFREVSDPIEGRTTAVVKNEHVCHIAIRE